MEEVKKDNVARRYSLLWLSGGLYIFVWIRLLFEDLNKAIGQDLYSSKRIQMINITIFSIELIAIVLLIISFSMKTNFQYLPQIKLVAIYSGITLFLSLNFSLVIIYKTVLRIKKKKISIFHLLQIIMMTLFVYSSFAFLQKKINSILPKNNISGSKS